MKKKILAAMSMIGLLLTVSLYSVSANDDKSVDFLFVHDTHSHLESFQTLVDGETKTVGGFAKLKTLIDEKKAENPETILVDAGDFSMGTLVQTVFETEAAELRMLGALGVEATTLGNHEFDYRTQGLVNMLDSAMESGDDLPTLLLSNIDWAAMEEAGLTEQQQLLKDSFDSYGMKEYMIIEKDGVKIALLGIFGEDSLDCAPMCPLVFEDASTAVKRVISSITEEVDMYVCLSHSGTWEETEKSEDEILAKNVPELDLIISGHTHTTLEEPIRHGDTYIVSCGEYGKNLGSLSMHEAEDGIWEMDSYELIPVTEDIAEDQAAKEKVDGFIESINTDYLSQFGYTREQVLTTNDIPFSTVGDLSSVHTEHNLGSLIADAYAFEIGEEVDVAIAPAGTIRDTYAEGEITVEQVFNSFSLGIGPDGVPGYPLVKTYLTGEELKIVAEIDGSISDILNYARLYMSGLHFTYNPNRMILNKVTNCYLMKDGERVEIEDDKLYCVVSDLYSAQMLGSVTDMSYGLLKIVPKFADGTPAEDYEDLIVVRDGKEVKAWAAIANYMDSFEDTDGDGVGNMPQDYAQEQGRKVVNDSKNLLHLINHPNKYAMLILGVGSIAFVVVVIVVCSLRDIVKKIWARSKKNKV